MAIQNTAVLTDLSGRPVPTNNIVISAVHFPKPTLNKNAQGGWDGTVTRLITYDIFVYVSKATLQALDDFIQGGVREFPSGWQREMTEQEYLDILANGMLAEVWLKDYINALIGGTSTIVNPYI
jgi:hypothetical protein